MIMPSMLVAGVLVMAGIAAIAATRNIIKIVMGLQSIGLGIVLLLSLLPLYAGMPAKYVIVLVAVTSAATEAVALVVVVASYQKFRNIDPRKISELKW